MKLNKAFTLLEPGPVVLVTTHVGKHSNVMTISWTMGLDGRTEGFICHCRIE